MTKRQYFKKYQVQDGPYWKRCDFCGFKDKRVIYLLHKTLICYDCFIYDDREIDNDELWN